MLEVLKGHSHDFVPQQCGPSGVSSVDGSIDLDGQEGGRCMHILRWFHPGYDPPGDGQVVSSLWESDHRHTLLQVGYVSEFQRLWIGVPEFLVRHP
eukprot:scaffold109_cov368-Pavlova_lutheri.AAC.22